MVTRRRGLEGSDLHSQTARHFPFDVPGANRYDRFTSTPAVRAKKIWLEHRLRHGGFAYARVQSPSNPVERLRTIRFRRKALIDDNPCSG